MKTSTSIVYLPSELAVMPKDKIIPRARVAGKVTVDEFNYQIEPEIHLSFYISDPEGESNKKIPVSYNKLMPDMFAPGRSVIINGTFKDGTLLAKNLMTQCPSKYEPPTVTESEK